MATIQAFMGIRYYVFACLIHTNNHVYVCNVCMCALTIYIYLYLILEKKGCVEQAQEITAIALCSSACYKRTHSKTDTMQSQARTHLTEHVCGMKQGMSKNE